MNIIDRLLNVPSIDPDDARRRKLLNILLLGLSVIAFLGVTVLGTVSIASLSNFQDILRLFYAFGGSFLGFILLLLINRYWSGWLAGVLFVIFLSIVIGLSDAPEQVVEGRTLFLFAIPILVASVVLPAWTSFVAAAFSSLVVSLVASTIDYVPPIPSMFGFFAIALVSWIAARSLQGALTDLRAINAELDQRVLDRTRELAEMLSENQAILESIADGVIVFDNNGQAVVANPAISRLVGRSIEKIIGCDIAALMGQDVNAQDRETMIGLLRDPDKEHAALKLEWGKKTLSVSCAPVHSEAGGTAGAVAVYRDFTREAELERMKSAFVSMVSHELRTPLNAILGYADMLSEGIYGELNEKQGDVMQRILTNTGRQLSLVNDLLDRAQIEAGTISFNFAQVKLVDLVHEVYSTMVVLAEPKGLKLNCHIDRDMPAEVYSDAQRLHQILINLVSNAIKFTDQGYVNVDISRFDDAHWSIQVSDTGAGIPKNAREYIFAPFHRVDNSATRKHKGAGLGLSIVKQLVNMMGGDVTVDGRVDQGSVFTVVLPFTPPE